MGEDRLAHAARVLEAEAAAVRGVVKYLDTGFSAAVDALLDCTGRVVVVGVGKSWLVGQKLSATLASTGTPSYCVHATEAAHGDLGRLCVGDVLLALSYSGETAEVLRCVQAAHERSLPVLALTGMTAGRLAQLADVLLCIGKVEEAGPLGLAPSASTTAMLALGDALALGVARERRLTEAEYARMHPAGSLGLRLQTVRERMRTGDRCPRARPTTPVAEALLAMTRVRAGAMAVVDEEDRLVGLFTDGDLRRALAGGEQLLQRPLAEVMTPGPTTAGPELRVEAAAGLLAAHGFDELPVVDARGVLLGMLDIQDLLQARD